MATTSITLSALDQTTVSANADYLAQLLNEAHPALDTSYGSVLRQLLITPAAVFYTLNSQNIANLNASQSLLQVATNPTLASPAVVDGILSNFLVARAPATYTTGSLVLTVGESVFTPVPIGTVFVSASGINFQTVSQFWGVSDVDSVTPTSRLIETGAAGTSYFTVDVVAADAGPSVILSGTAFTIKSTVSNVTAVYAASDFVTGAAEQTNQELIAELSTGISAKSTADRQSISALIKSSFTGIAAVSIIGNGDIEMSRDKHNIFGIGTGGKADVYVKPGTAPTITLTNRPAVLINAAEQVFQLSFASNEFPGFYRVEAIKPAGSGAAGSLSIIMDTRSLNTPTADFTPYFGTTVEGIYSAYQTAVVQFVDPAASTSGMVAGTSTTNYDVYVSAIPSIGAIQNLLIARDRRTPAGDYLVRAAIPCFVSITVNVKYRSDQITFTSDTAAGIQTAIAAAINSLDFSAESIPASLIVNTVSGVIGSAGYADVPVDIRGVIRAPSGTNIYIYGPDRLVIPTVAEENISPRTVGFYLRSSDVVVNPMAVNYNRI